jgi:O-antigen/teichoic acid export membrane protein
MSKHYNSSRIRQSLIHFITGKAFTAISTLSVMLLLARALPKADYAVVITVEAIVTLTGMAASFGINQTLLRYIPELRVENNGLALYRLIRNAIISRAWVFGLAIIGLAAAGPWLAEWLHFSGRISLLPLFLIAGWTSLMWFLVAQVMESLMWQKTSQYTIAITAALRLTLLGISYSQGEADLERVVWIEVITHNLTLIMLLLGTWYNQRQDPYRLKGNLSWFHDNKKRISRYALHGYGFSLSSLLYGSHSNRAISARFLSSSAMGDYGFADSLTNLFRRFLPSALLIGFIRPLYFARYTETNQLHDLERMANLIFRINLVFLGMAALTLIFFGKPVLDILTSGKYGDTVYLVSAMLGVLALESLRMQYVLLCQTIEENGILIYSNIILSLSLILSLPFFPAIGAWAIVLANLVGNILSIIYIHIRFAPRNVAFKLDMPPILNTLLGLAIAIGAGYQIQIISNWILAGIASLIVFAALLVILKSFTNTEIMYFKNLLRKDKNNVKPA